MAWMDPPDFDGETYDRDLDHERLTSQLNRVRAVLADGRWHTVSEVARAIGAPDASVPSVTARIRDLRKTKFGGWFVQSRRAREDESGLWLYRMLPQDHPEAQAEQLRTMPPPEPSTIRAALVDFRAGMQAGLRQGGYRLQNRDAVEHVGLWLRKRAGEDVEEEIIEFNRRRLECSSE